MNVAVLLAAYNGEHYLEKQILSILNQENVEITLYISLDKSTDNSSQIIRQIQKKYKNIFLLESKVRLGNACNNFFYLLSSIEFKDYDFISLSDQDDIWFKNKIYRATSQITEKNIDSYSSNVIAIWKDKNKKNKKIFKSFNQKDYDHFFESAGPGNTYVFKKDFAIFIKNFLINNKENIRTIEHYDWFIYSLAKENNYKWLIDDFFSMYYLQHEKNEIGANLGLVAFIKRIHMIFRKNWFQQARIIASISANKNKKFLEKWTTLDFQAFIFLAYYSKKCRRNPKDQFLFFAICIIFSFKSIFLSNN